MRGGNLKKVLSLVLAMAMMLSVMVVGAGAAYKDGDKISAEYEVAVEVASQLGILEGFEDGSYGPQKTLTRAQLATMIYRITTGDVEDDYTANFAGGAAASFTDTPADQWYAGYIGYSADAGYLKGVGNDLYKPNSPLTGYQALAALLRGLGYNEKDHNFCGADWTVQVAKVANEKGIIDGIKGVDFNEPITREVAAQMIYNALFTEMVEWTLARGYQENGKFLAKEVFGIVNVDKDGTTAAGDFGRPSTEWYDKDKEALVSIPEAPLATYVEAVAGCDIIDDTGLEEDDVLDVYTNGVQGADITLPDTTAKNFGAQGRLTEVYEDVIVYIDTYLAEVTDVITEKVDSKNHVTREAAIELDVFKTGTTSYTFETKDFAEGDMVLVTIDAGEVATVVDAKSAIGELTGLKGNIRATDDIQKVVAIDGKDVTVNHTAVLGAMMGLDENYVFYYDTYGNVIGSEEVASEYVVIDSIWFETIKGETTVYADVVDFAANETEEVVVANQLPFENKALNQAFYYNVYEYVIEDGEYILTDADFVDFGAVSYTAGDTTLTGEARHPIQLNDETVVLMQTAFSPDGQYTSYTGYKTLPTFLASDVEVLDEDHDGYADLVYVLGARMSDRTVFIADIAPVRTDVIDDGNETIVTMEAYELVDGKLVETTFATTGWWNPERNSWEGDEIYAVGLYEIAESEDGYTWFVERAIPYEQVSKLTADGNRVMIEGQGYVALDNAEVFKFEGNWSEVADVTEDDEWTKADLGHESLVFLQENEDGDVVAVYDMWILLNVIDKSNVANEPVIFAGKTIGDEDLVLSLPAHTAYTVTTGGNAFVGTASDAHDCDSDHKYCAAHTQTIALDGMKFFQDISVLTYAIDKENHTGLSAKAGVSNVVVGNDNVVYADATQLATFTAENLLDSLRATCGHAQGFALYDNNGAVAGDLQLFASNVDLTIVVTAEDGTTQTYPVVIYN